MHLFLQDGFEDLGGFRFGYEHFGSSASISSRWFRSLRHLTDNLGIYGFECIYFFKMVSKRYTYFSRYKGESVRVHLFLQDGFEVYARPPEALTW